MRCRTTLRKAETVVRGEAESARQSHWRFPAIRFTQLWGSRGSVPGLTSSSRTCLHPSPTRQSRRQCSWSGEHAAHMGEEGMKQTSWAAPAPPLRVHLAYGNAPEEGSSNQHQKYCKRSLVVVDRSDVAVACGEQRAQCREKDTVEHKPLGTVKSPKRGKRGLRSERTHTAQRRDDVVHGNVVLG